MDAASDWRRSQLFYGAYSEPTREDMGPLGEISRNSLHRGPSRSRLGRSSQVVVLALLAVSAQPAQAQPQTQTPKVVSARLELTLPENCGTAAWFIDRIRMRSDRIRFHPDEKNLIVRGRVSVVNAGLVRAQMSLQQSDGSQAKRVIEASTCEQALDGLALLTAVTLDPTADPSPAPTTQRPEQSPPHSSASRDTPRSTLTQTAPPEDRTGPPRQDPATRDPATRDPHGSPYGIWASVNVMGLNGPSPQWMVGPEVTLGIESEPLAPFAASARLSLAHLERDGIAAAGGVADFSLSHASLEACPLRLGAAPLILNVCAEVLIGRLKATGRLTGEPEEHVRTFTAAGASGDLNIRISKYFSVPVRGFALVPFVRDTYQFAPSQFFRTPAAAIGAAAGVSVRFW